MHRLDLETGSFLDLRPLNKESPSFLVLLVAVWFSCLLSKVAVLRDLNTGEGNFSSRAFPKAPGKKQWGEIQDLRTPPNSLNGSELAK